jgi:hypothetical protein
MTARRRFECCLIVISHGNWRSSSFFHFLPFVLLVLILTSYNAALMVSIPKPRGNKMTEHKSIATALAKAQAEMGKALKQSNNPS